MPPHSFASNCLFLLSSFLHWFLRNLLRGWLFGGESFLRRSCFLLSSFLHTCTRLLRWSRLLGATARLLGRRFFCGNCLFHSSLLDWLLGNFFRGHFVFLLLVGVVGTPALGRYFRDFTTYHTNFSHNLQVEN